VASLVEFHESRALCLVERWRELRIVTVTAFVLDQPETVTGGDCLLRLPELGKLGDRVGYAGVPTIGDILVHESVEITVFGRLLSRLPVFLTQIHPTKHRRLVGAGERPVEIPRHREIVEQVGYRQRRSVFL